MKKTKIDWCDCTVNPVVGCPNGCDYCYARKLNARFKWIDEWCKPRFFPERLKDFQSKNPKTIFINSMSDIAYWEEKWLIEVLNAIEDNKQHKYIALTKNYELFLEKVDRLTETMGWDIEGNLFVGQTFDRQPNPNNLYASDFINIEPMLEEMETDEWVIDGYGSCSPIGKAIIVGAETGNRKGKVVPLKEWVDKLVEYADDNKIPIFMKGSLRKIMGDDFRQDKLPWEVRDEQA